MIPNTTQTTALFAGSGQENHEKRVAAWDDDGRALVPSQKGHLVVATDSEGFLGLLPERPAKPGEQVAYLPGDGWHVMYASQRNRANASLSSQTLLPVVAFLCTDEQPSGAIPLVDAGGHVVPAGQMSIGDRELMKLVDPDAARRWHEKATRTSA
jgi:hypothetical protein